jgi:DNA transposition AAA+ family ATPase
MKMNKLPSPDRFLITKQHRRFVEFCDACRRYRYIGLCYGAPGVGKTMSARTYAHWDRIEPYLHTHPTSRPWPKLRASQLRTVLYTPTVVNSPKRIRDQIADLRGHLLTFIFERVRERQPQASGTDTVKRLRQRELILVDEADRLLVNGLEEIRDLYDRYDLAVVFLGLPGLEKRLTRYPQLYSRVGFVHHFQPLSSEELHVVLRHKWQQLGLTLDGKGTDAEAVAAIRRITGGNFRLLQRLFSQIERVMQINQLRTVTKEVVEAARELLVIGPT